MPNPCGILVVLIAVIGGAPTNTPAESLRTYRNESFGIAFDYPAAWGDVVVMDYREPPLSTTYGMDWRLRFEDLPFPFSAHLLVKAVTDSTRLRVINDEGFVSTTDLVDLRQAIASYPDCVVGGNPAQITESYDEPGEYSVRSTIWFSGGRCYEFTAGAIAGQFAHYRQGTGRIYGFSRLVEANPDDMRLRHFSDEFADVLESMRETD